MPYVNNEARDRIDLGGAPETIGELNYKITQACLDYLGDREPSRYKDYNEIVGVLECVKLEFYRRAVLPYEEEKIAIEGDVY